MLKYCKDSRSGMLYRSRARWGFGDALVDCYYDYYGSDDEEEL